MTLPRSDYRNSLICAAVSTMALLLAWPFANLPFDDDWTWSFTVWKLLTTGHLVYNGLSSPPVIAQAYWGLLWVKLFGFSFNVLRLSSWPMAVGAVGLSYLVGRQGGLNPAMAAFASLLLGLSPLYMPLESTFMTDVPGVFFMLLSMYALVRGFESQSPRAASAWLLFGAIAALVGGSSRQVVWIVPLVVLPYFAWLRRKDLGFVLSAIVGWLIVFTGAMALQHWYARQPYALPDPPALSYVHALAHDPRQFVIDLIGLILTLVMTLLPAAIGTVRLRLGIIELVGFAIFVPLFYVLHRMKLDVEPWVGNIFTSHGVLAGIELFSYAPRVISYHAREVISLAVIGSIALLLAIGIVWTVRNWRSSCRQFFAFFLSSPGVDVAIPAMVILSLALFALEVTRVISQVDFDRHLLPFIPFSAIPLLMAIQHRGLARMPIWSWMVLVVYAGYAVASTQDVNSLARARVTAIQKLEDAGIAASQIDGGFEHNLWTQVEVQGHVNDPRIQNPPGTYDKTKGPAPGLNCVYILEYARTPETLSTRFGSVRYFSLLPPFHRTVYIDHYTEAWLDPKKAATRPVDKPLVPRVLLDQYNSK